MDRRNFIKSLLASGALGSSPLAAQAANELFTPGAAQPVLIVGQSGLPHADELVLRLTQVFVAAGIKHVKAEATGSELIEYSHVTALLDGVPGHRVIGVMDDAAALIFQELAAVRGAACVVSTHHRFAAQEVRHCFTSAGLEANIVWSDSLADHAERIGRLYAGTLGGQEPAADRSAHLASDNSAREADGTPGSLVSFLINV
jgi:hypothetical protein